MPSPYTWPISLPAAPLIASYSESKGGNILRTPMDAGPAKMRARGSRPDTITCLFVMTKTQLATLDTFVRTTVSFVKRFNFTHPRTGSTVEVRFVPSEDDQLYSIAAINTDNYNVTMKLEVMP